MSRDLNADVETNSLHFKWAQYVNVLALQEAVTEDEPAGNITFDLIDIVSLKNFAQYLYYFI